VIAPIVLICTFLTPARAFHKDFILVNDRAPLEFKLAFETLKGSVKDPALQVKLIAYAQRINAGLGPLGKDQAFFLVKSEVHKTFIEWRFPPTTFRPTALTLERLRTNRQASAPLYTPLSQWVLETLVADFEPYAKENLLELTPSQAAALTGDKRQAALKLQRVMSHLAGWTEQADTLSATDFNALTAQLGWQILERVQERAQLLRRFATQAVADTQAQTFNIPATGLPRVTAPQDEGAPVPSVRETSEANKESAAAAVEAIDVKSSDIPVEDKSKAIDGIDAAGGDDTMR
jgi:hypothetical protein